MGMEQRWRQFLYHVTLWYVCTLFADCNSCRELIACFKCYKNRLNGTKNSWQFSLVFKNQNQTNFWFSAQP